MNNNQNRIDCDIYLNKCKLKQLHNKYLIGIVEPGIYTQETIDTILFASIKTRTVKTEEDQAFLITISNPPLTIIQNEAFHQDPHDGMLYSRYKFI